MPSHPNHLFCLYLHIRIIYSAIDILVSTPSRICIATEKILSNASECSSGPETHVIKLACDVTTSHVLPSPVLDHLKFQMR